MNKTPRGKSVKKMSEGGSTEPLKKVPLYSATIKVLGKKFSASGNSAIEAISNLDVGRLNKGVSVLEVSHDGSSASKILPSVQTMRLFSPSKLTREIALKNVSLRFLGL